MKRAVETSIRYFVPRLRGVGLLWALAYGICCPSTWGQHRVPYNPGLTDSDYSFPASTGILGQTDSSAVSELSAHLSAAGAVPWRGLQATGSISYGGSSSGEYPATLSILGENRFRLDATTPTGTTSIRIHGQMRQVQIENHAVLTQVSDSGTAALVLFQLPRASTFLGSKLSIIDHGMVTLGASSYHRLSYQLPSLGFSTVSGSAAKTTAIDLYFDPVTHLVSASAAIIVIPGSRNVTALRVVTYADYRPVDGQMIPFRYTESVGGQLQWTLRLSDVSTTPTLSEPAFTF